VSGLVQVRRDRGREFQILGAATLKLREPNDGVVRGALGDPVCAPLVNLQLRLPGMNEYTGK